MDKRIEEFLNKVSNQISTEEEANKIKDELYDHIDCLVEEFKDMGYSDDDCIKKALMQMGDPSEIGYSFTNTENIRKRNSLMRMLKTISMGLYILGIIMVLFTVDDILVLLSVVFDIIYSFNIYGLFTKRYSNISKHVINSQDIPILIVWPVKKRLHIEYIIGAFILAPLIILVCVGFVAAAIEDNKTLPLILIIIIFSSSLILGIVINKLRVSKYILTNDGLIIYGKFISYTSIGKIKWLNSYYKNEREYMFQILDNRDIPISKKIKVSTKQYKIVSTVLSERV